MTYEIKSLAGRQLFWKTLFEEKMLAPQLATLATEHVDGITYDGIPKYDKLHRVIKKNGGKYANLPPLYLLRLCR
jgi:hypothetical protein